ncbi:hypothetical protein CXF83_06735 [Shewanella sp. Choline-02u-19]|jgi:hypothetical protein|uniref:hypothetical protein n=1 Tax=unclassified Shewanella TaxID=196818 RepID=UPI000C32997E|nr:MULTISPECIES: hypothetical protein [unclassified Shewanella]PKG56219.1 hypothetical protein CXF82_15920 [Shewanella sp. GutDb-MelDb]PKG75950.1 hypothetical protein CXF86_03285 [Shewanella sp. GutCb]PKH56772.1 hypothetical protein CXF84_12755 [Shewanella sp. Bg11-22]PKI30323.1 hypothetical protein CXF83_06735 [Shewanella sp. Choline-02u-19]
MKASQLRCWVSYSVLFYFSFSQSLYASDDVDVAIDKIAKRLPIFSQKLSFYLPHDWKLAFSQSEDGMFTAEFLPKNEQLRNWSSMVCIQGFKDLSANIEPSDFLDTMAEAYRDNCYGDVLYERVDDEFIDGHQTASAIMGCTRMPNTHLNGLQANVYKALEHLGEIGHYTAVKGENDLYLIHKSMRGEEFTSTSAPVERANYREFMSAITPFKLN